MKYPLIHLATVMAASLVFSGCSSNDSNNSNNKPSSSSSSVSSSQSSSVSSGGEQASVYEFVDGDGESTVSYGGQIYRHVLIEDMKAAIGALQESQSDDVSNSLNFYINGADEAVKPMFQVGSETMAPLDQNSEFTYGAIGSNKNLSGKIAGGDGTGGGETARLIDGTFFGWEEGLSADPLPIDLVNHYIDTLEAAVTDGNTPQVATANGNVSLDVVYVDEYGRDFQQLMQKFLLMAVGFSQGTNDYLLSSFADELAKGEDDQYSTAEHHWDEGFGYFGAARDYNTNYTDVEIADGVAKDSDNDGMINVLSEVNFGQSTNCAKRDKGTASNNNPTNYTDEAFSAFLAGRKILHDATMAGELTAAQQTELDAAIQTASLTWEKCIAATVVHYINDVIADYDNIDGDNDTYQSLDTYKNLAKHWSEMKGFALGLQFSPASPFRADAASLANLQMILQWIGDAPVLADGTQMGAAYQDGIEGYKQDLLDARDLLQAAYGFDAENVANW